MNNSKAPSYQWQKNGVNIPGANSAAYIEQNPVNNDFFICTVTDSLPCVGNTSRTGDIRLQVEQPVVPSVSVNVQPGNLITEGQEVTFTAIPVNGGGIPAYLWKKNGVSTGVYNAVFRTSTLANNDEIYVEMHSVHMCANPATVESNRIKMTVTTVSVGDTEHAWGNVSIYPNPAQGAFTVEGSDVTEPDVKMITLHVRTLTGQIVHTAEIPIKAKKFSHQVNLPESVTNGIYIIWLQDKHRKVISRIYINR